MKQKKLKYKKHACISSIVCTYHISLCSSLLVDTSCVFNSASVNAGAMLCYAVLLWSPLGKSPQVV